MTNQGRRQALWFGTTLHLWPDHLRLGRSQETGGKLRPTKEGLWRQQLSRGSTECGIGGKEPVLAQSEHEARK